MLRFVAFDVRADEIEYFDRWGKELGVELTLHDFPLTGDNVELCDGADGVSILGVTEIDAALAAALAQRHVVFVATRSIGYDNVDVAAANAAGVRITHVAYPPEAVAEFTVMLLLMTVRKARQILRRAEIQDYSLSGSMGRQLSELTVGIVGAGRIGAAVARRLHPFGCRILAYDVYRDPKLADVVEYVSLETLLRNSDAITLHAPALPENHHMFDAKQFEMMRDGVILVNCARGDLINTPALIDAIESGKVQGAALDTIEYDLRYYHQDQKLRIINDHDMAILSWFPNVMLTPHIAFYTDTVMSEMVGCSLRALHDLATTGQSQMEVHPTGVA